MKRHLPFALICVFLCVLAISCRTQTGWSSPEFAKSQVNASFEDNMKWSSQLYANADLFLELQGGRFERFKPPGSDGKHVFGVLPQIIPGTNVCGRSLAVVGLYDGYTISTNYRTLEEDALDLHDYLKAQGFRRVVVLEMHDAMYFEMFPNGWPSRAEIEKKSREERQGAVEFQRQETVKIKKLFKKMDTMPLTGLNIGPAHGIMPNEITSQVVAEGEPIVPPLIENLDNCSVTGAAFTVFCLRELKTKEAQNAVLKLKNELKSGTRFRGVKRDYTLDLQIQFYLSDVGSW